MELLRSLIVGGLAKGGAYALVAVGYTMVYGAISVIHFAHGEIFMIGAFSALIFASVLGSLGLAGWGLLAAAAAAGCVWAAAYGYFTEKAACQPLRGAGPLAALISAIGMSLFLQNFVFLAQTPSTIPFPELIPEIKLLSPYKHIITSAQAAAIITSALALSALLLFLRKTRAGAAMRAAAQDPETARLCGVSWGRAISWTFIAASLAAALGGVLAGCGMRQVSFYMGFLAGMKAFTAAVIGGLGSVPGAILGAIVLGLAESLTAGLVSSSYEDAAAFLLLIAVATIRPEGLAGRREAPGA